MYVLALLAGCTYIIKIALLADQKKGTITGSL